MNILLILVFNRSNSRRSSVSTVDFDEFNDDDEETTSDDPSKKKKKFLRVPFLLKIAKLNGPEWPWVVLGAVCSILYGAVQPIFSLFFSQVYGLFAEPNLEEQKRLTSIYAGGIFAIGFAGGVTQFLSTFGFSKSGEELTMRMRQMTFSAILRQEMGYFDCEANSVGALVTRLSSDASAIKVNNPFTKFFTKCMSRV